MNTRFRFRVADPHLRWRCCAASMLFAEPRDRCRTGDACRETAPKQRPKHGGKPEAATGRHVAPAEAVARSCGTCRTCSREAAPAEEAPTPTADKGDTAWILVCAALVIFMTLPGLALFYGGLVRSKNVLSILMQCLVVFSLVAVLWALYGYSLAFTENNAFIGGGARLFAAGLNGRSARPSPRACISRNSRSSCSRARSPASPAR
jgi:uncharacterized protein with PQ loop repeat